MFDPNPMWCANWGNLSMVQAEDTLNSYQPIVLISLWGGGGGGGGGGGHLLYGIFLGEGGGHLLCGILGLN